MSHHLTTSLSSRTFNLLLTAVLLAGLTLTLIASQAARAQPMPGAGHPVDGHVDSALPGRVTRPDATGDAATDSLPPGVTTDWWSAVQENIRRSEYRVTWQERTLLPGSRPAYQAPNRAQNLRIYFTPEGIRVLPRVVSGEQLAVSSQQLAVNSQQSPGYWELGLSLTAWGRLGALQPVGAASLHPDANRIEYHYQPKSEIRNPKLVLSEAEGSEIVEWYVNSAQGLEHGFQVATRPTGEGPLVLESFAAINPDLQAATKLWRPPNQPPEVLAREGLRFLRSLAEEYDL